MTGRRTNGDGAVYQTKDGRWRAAVDLGWKDGARQRKYLSASTKAAVRRKVREALTQVESGLPLTRDGVGPTVEEWLWYWYENVQSRRVRESTLTAQEIVIRRHLVPTLGKVRLRELTPEHVESLLVRLETPSFNSTSVLKVHRILSRALVVAMQRGLVSRNVSTLIDAPTPQEHEVEPLSREDARRLLAAAQSRRNAARWTLALAIGLRQGEALGLAWPQVDLERGTVAIRQALNRPRYTHGCGRPPTCRQRPVDCPQGSGHGMELADVKSRAGKRVVTLPQPLVEALRAHRAAQLEERLAAGSTWWAEPQAPKGKTWDLVFRAADGKPIGHKIDHAAWKALLADAGVRDARLARRPAHGREPAAAPEGPGPGRHGHPRALELSADDEHVQPRRAGAQQRGRGAHGPRPVGRARRGQERYDEVVRDGIEPPTPRFSGVGL